MHRPGRLAAEWSSRALRQMLGQDALPVDMAFGVEVDDDFRSGEAMLQLLLDRVHPLMCLRNRPVARHPNMELNEPMRTRSAGPEVMQAGQFRIFLRGGNERLTLAVRPFAVHQLVDRMTGGAPRAVHQPGGDGEA